MKLAILGALLLSNFAQAAISLDAISSGQAANVATSVTWNHVTAAGATIAVVGCSGARGGTLTSVAYNGSNITNIRNDTNGSLWYVTSPASGTQAILVTEGGAGSIICTAMTFFGTLTTSSVIDANAGNSTVGASSSQAITTVTANDYLVENIVGHGTTGIGTSPTWSATSGQTVEFNNLSQGILTVGVIKVSGGFRAVTTATSYTESWLNTDAGTDGLADYQSFSIVALAPGSTFVPSRWFFSDLMQLSERYAAQ